MSDDTRPTNLYRVTMEKAEGVTDGWDVYVIAAGLGDAVEIATDANPYRIDHPLTVRMLPVLQRDED